MNGEWEGGRRQGWRANQRGRGSHATRFKEENKSEVRGKRKARVEEKVEHAGDEGE